MDDLQESDASWDPEILPLLAAMQAASENDNSATRRALYEELLTSTLLVPTPGPGKQSSFAKRISFEAGDKVALITGRNLRGMPALLAFTHTEALEKWSKGERGYLALRGPDLCALALHNSMNSIVVNPAGPIGGEIGEREIRLLAEGAVISNANVQEGVSEVSYPQGATVRLSPPPEDDVKRLTRSLKRLFRRHEVVVAGYLFQAAVGSGESHLVVGVLFRMHASDLAKKALFGDLSAELKRFMGPGEYIDMMALEDLDILRSVRNLRPPLFERRS